MTCVAESQQLTFFLYSPLNSNLIFVYGAITVKRPKEIKGLTNR